MNSELDSKIIELESKIQILERENEVLSAKAEENLLLNRAFEEINVFEDIDNLLINTLEGISVLLDIQFSGIFDLIDNKFDCISSYALFDNDDTTNVKLNVSKEILDKLFSNQICYFGKNDPNLFFEYPNPIFVSETAVIVPIISEFSEHRYFVFVNDSSGRDLESRMPIFEKIIRIISARIERIYYQNELKKLNQELSEKIEIIKSQNSELNSTLDYLKETQSKLVQSEKMASLGVLTAGVAHEINNPLNFIMGGYEGLEEYFSTAQPPPSDTVKVLLNGIFVGVERVASIVKGLNQFTSSVGSFNEDCEIHSIIDNCLLIANNQIESTVRIEKKYSDKSLIIKGNSGKLHQVFINILTNALHSIDDCEGTISITTSIDQSMAVIEIADTGCGIDNSVISKITDPFFTTKDPGKGIGLGLSIVYNNIREHNGRLDFSSTVCKGTTVIISLPFNQ